jgi:hypothetical protein
MSDMPTELCEQEWCAFLTTALVPNWVLNFDLVKNSAIVQLDEQCISDRAFVRCMILRAEVLVLDAMNLSTKCIDTRVGSRFVRAIEIRVTRCEHRDTEISKEDGLALRVEVSVYEWISDHIADCVAAREFYQSLVLWIHEKRKLTRGQQSWRAGPACR